MTAVARRALLVALLCVACGDDDPGLEYRGTPGTPVAAGYDALVPTVAATVNGGGSRNFLVDTGAPITILDRVAFPEFELGPQPADLATFGLTFPSYGVVVMDLFGADPDDPGAMHGILGGDLLRHFALSLDYRDGRAWLSDPFDPAARPPGLAVGELESFTIDVVGGGRSLVPPNKVIDVPPTRILTLATFEGDPQPRWVLVDTGASAVVVREDYLESLGDVAGRPRLDGVTVGTVYGPITTYLSRVWRVRLDGADGAGRVAVDDVPILTLPPNALFDGIAAEVQLDVVALIGGTYLRWYWTTIDYPTKRMHLARYTDPAHIAPNEFIGVGFTLARSGDDWVISDCYPGTDAYVNEGLRRGDIVEEIDGMSITGQDTDVVGALLGAFRLGDEVPVGIRSVATIEPHLVLVEDLLPSYPPP